MATTNANTNRDEFAATFEQVETMVGWLKGDEAAALSHGDLETRLASDGRELLRRMMQDHLDRRAEKEVRLDEVLDAEGTPHRSAESGHARTLRTIFGEVVVERIAYRRPGHPNLHPADGVLNLPEEKQSHGLRRLAALEAPRDSYDSTVEAIERATGQHLGKRQVEEMVVRGSTDVDAFYQTRSACDSDPDDVLVLSVDGKGIVMRRDSLRPATARAAERSATKLRTRLSGGEKANRKRIAEVGTVYDVTPEPRTPDDILARCDGAEHDHPAPVATNKWLTASVVHDAAEVVGGVFDEAERRDPSHQRTWVALVDGNNDQIDAIKAQARKRKIKVTILIDLIHVMEYAWGAAWCFFNQGDPAAEKWVHQKVTEVLCGKAGLVAAAIRRKATTRGLDPDKRANADKCADYLLRKQPYLDYPTALAQGWPIATGVIEGACRHLVKDRFDRTGSRWGLKGAEAVLKLRAVHSNGDFDKYWTFHQDQERRRIHQSRYTTDIIPVAA
jgi:hypothetical protein